MLPEGSPERAVGEIVADKLSKFGKRHWICIAIFDRSVDNFILEPLHAKFIGKNIDCSERDLSVGVNPLEIDPSEKAVERLRAFALQHHLVIESFRKGWIQTFCEKRTAADEECLVKVVNFPLVPNQHLDHL